MSDLLNTNLALVERTQPAAALDQLIRRHLGVADPRNATAIAKALRQRYTDEDQVLDLEASGLPYFRVPRVETHCPTETGSRAEVRQAEADVDRDLTALASNALLKDIHPELDGWSRSIREAITDGFTAARNALDPWQRDRALAARRLFGNYARAARFVGALTPNLSINYRKLAQSLDEAASVIFVLIGDALADAGQGSGRFLLQAPVSELQARRDAVIHALRTLTVDGYGSNDWPRSLAAYRQLLNYLEDNGLTDLRALFQENNVMRDLDEMIRLCNKDLRGAGAVAPLTLERYRRLVQLLGARIDPSAPALAAYLTALQLFVDAFENGDVGYRLLYISRPPITFYGLYSNGGPDNATNRLIELILRRGRLAEMLDCYLGCNCSREQVQCQILLDKILYDLDRAIDLYALGQRPEGNGQAEQRAVAYGLLVDQMLRCKVGEEFMVRCPPRDSFSPSTVECEPIGCADRYPPFAAPHRNLGVTLGEIRGLLWYPDTLVPGGPSPGSNYITCPIECEEEEIHIHNTFGRGALQRALDELCVQGEAEAQLESLLHTMAPSCRIAIDGGVLTPTNNLIQGAIKVLQRLDECIDDQQDEPEEPEEIACPHELRIPPHFETSLDGLANVRGTAGEKAMGITIRGQ